MTELTPQQSRQAGETAGTGGSSLAARLGPVLVLVVLFALYYRGVRYPFVDWDDNLYVVDNPFIRTFTWETVRWAFTSFYLDCWIPLTWISLALNYHLSGLNPYGYHLTNIALHCLNTGIVMLIARQGAQLFAPQEESAGRRFRLLFPLLAGMLWGFHPMKVESVAWVTERKDVLAGFFALLAVYWRYPASLLRGEGDVRLGWRRLPALAAFILSLCTKPMAVALPAVFLVVDRYLARRSGREFVLHRSLAGLTPYFLASGAVAVLTLVSQGPNLATLEDLPPGSRVVSAVISLGGYLAKFIWPVKLSPMYIHGVRGAVVASPDFLIACALLLAVAAACIRTRRRFPSVGASVACFAVLLVPTPTFVQVGPQYMADRYLYLPSLFPSVVLAAWISRAISSGAGERRKSWFRVAVAAVAAAIFALGTLTFQQVAIWRNALTLWSRAIEIYPERVGFAYYYRGMYYMSQGQLRETVADFDKSIAIAREKRYKKLNNLYYMRGKAHLELGMFREAVADASAAIDASVMPKPEFFQLRCDARKALGQLREAEQDRALGQSLLWKE